jgi:hypothetical protein
MNSMNILVAAALFCAPASAQSLQVIYCEIPSSPKSVVPGALETTTGLPEATNFRALEDLFVSPDGTRWMIKARTQQGTDRRTSCSSGPATRARCSRRKANRFPAASLAS